MTTIEIVIQREKDIDAISFQNKNKTLLISNVYRTSKLTHEITFETLT